ncbi:hypothetical protein BGZ73_001385, partial [Actinomortierella ambigua]
LTGKKQGCARGKVNSDDVPQLLANYSFNDRPMYYYMLEVDKNKDIRVLESKIFKRLESAATFVAGSGNSLYPSKKNHGSKTLDFTDVGIVTVNNITIGWPKKKYYKSSQAVAEIYEFVGDEDTSMMVALGTIRHTPSYGPCYSALEEHKEYTAVAYGVGQYRGTPYFFIHTSNGRRIRCGRDLDSIMHSPKICVYEKVGRSGMMRACTNRRKFTFVSSQRSAYRGRRYMKCELVTVVDAGDHACPVEDGQSDDSQSDDSESNSCLADGGESDDSKKTNSSDESDDDDNKGESEDTENSEDERRNDEHSGDDDSDRHESSATDDGNHDNVMATVDKNTATSERVDNWANRWQQWEYNAQFHEMT